MPTRTRRPLALPLARICAAAHGAGAVVAGFLSLGYAFLAYATEHSAPGSGQDRYLSGVGVAIGLTGAVAAWGVAAALFTGAVLVGRRGESGRVTLIVVESIVLAVSLRWTEVALSNPFGALVWACDVALATVVLATLICAGTESRYRGPIR